MKGIAYLKPCPFCGGVEIFRGKSSHGQYPVIQCVNCGARGPRGNTMKKCEDTWNDRDAERFTNK